MKTKALIVSTLAISLIGCNDSPVEKVKTVDYYQQNKKELTLKIKECKNNIGELGQTPSCLNAFQATKANSSGKLTRVMWATDSKE